MPEISGLRGGWLDEAIQRVASGRVAEILAEVRRNLPDGSREALMPRTVYWEREHAAYRRQRSADPNPWYRPSSGQSGSEGEG